MTSLMKPDDSWTHNIPKKNIYVAFWGHLLCPSLDKSKMESVHPIHQQATVDGFSWVEVRAREAKG